MVLYKHRADGRVADGQKLETIGDWNMSDDFLLEYEGKGTEGLQAALPYLSICQKRAPDCTDERAIGEWWHSGLSKKFGPTVEVVVLGWANAWVERTTQGTTVGVYAPNSIQTLETGRGPQYKCVSAESGLPIMKTCVIPLMVGDDEETFALFVPTSFSMDAVKVWRRLLSSNRLSNGAKAPIFSHTWFLTIGFGEKNGFKNYRLESVKKGQQITKDFLTNTISPLLPEVQNPLRLAQIGTGTPIEQELMIETV